MKRLAFSILTLILAILPFRAVAQDSIIHTGSLFANGDGQVALSGNGTVSLTGRGILFIVDRAGDAEIEINGQGRQIQSSARGSDVFIYRRFEGDAVISGSEIAIYLNGSGIQLETDCSGVIQLKGEGTYFVDADEEVWSSDGVVLAIQGNATQPD